MRKTRKTPLIPNISFLFSVIIFLSCTSLSPVDGSIESRAPSPQTVQVRWQPFGAAAGEDTSGGVDYFAGKIARPRLEFHALRIDLSDPNILITASGRHGETFLSTKVSTFVRENGLLAGINALPFDPVSATEGEPRTNVGIIISEGTMISAPHRNFDALVFYADGAAAIISQAEIHSAENITTAVGGFRRILRNNEPDVRTVALKARHPRSAAGISADGKYLYLLVIDGRRYGSIGSTEAETALVLRSLGAGEGINFDGGGSSTLALRYPDGKIRTVNTPDHGGIPGRERAVAGCLGVGIRNKDKKWSTD